MSTKVDKSLRRLGADRIVDTAEAPETADEGGPSGGSAIWGVEKTAHDDGVLHLVLRVDVD